MEITKFSSWNGVDLHIHSIKSNAVKDNDYDGEAYTANELITTLLSKRIKIFSITDHNTLNTDLYTQISTELNKETFKNKANFVIGAEIDVKDKDVYKDVFHCLLFLDTRDIQFAKEVIDGIFDDKLEKDRNSEEAFPDVQKIFKTCHNKGVKNIILIPHYRDKHKSIEYRGPETNRYLDHLNCLCFNAYEDSNNIVNLQKSLKVYLDCGCPFPFVAFTDNHNLRIYPKGKHDKENTTCYMLSNIMSPFNSIKTAFEEPTLRISLDGVEGMRDTGESNKYIEAFIEDGKEYKLSPYGNTIIGRFGSGKSLLFHKLIHGSKSLNSTEKYRDFYDPLSSFQVKINGSLYDSIENCNDVKWYNLTQKEKYSYVSSFELGSIKQLFEQLKITFPFPSQDKAFTFNVDDLKTSYKLFESKIDARDNVDNLNYEKAFSNVEYFDVAVEVLEDIDTVIQQLDSFKNIENISSLKVNGIQIFTDDIISSAVAISREIKRVIKTLVFYKECDYYSSVSDIIQKYRSDYIKNDEKTKISKLMELFGGLSSSLINLRKECEKFCSVLTSEEYDSLRQDKKEALILDYSLVSKYANVEENFPSPVDVFAKKSDQKNSLFATLLNIKTNFNGVFKNSYTFEKCVDNYVKKINEMFTIDKLQYDIYKGETSLLKKSSGEKASLFMDLLFDLISDDIDKGKSIIVFLDQPENDIDNKNICESITDRITHIKKTFKNFQCFVITHNGNVGIGTDSENIIITSDNTENNKRVFSYDFGCIENAVFIQRACDILEGGKEAMIRRTAKYGINIIKKVEEHGNKM